MPAPIKIMLKMCSSSLQRKTSRLYRCKRKKENQGPRRKYERNNVPGALEVADVSAKLRRVFLNLLPLPSSTFLARVFPSFSCSHRGEDASLSRTIILFPLSHRQSLYHTQPALSISSSIFRLSFFLSLSLILFHALTFFLSLSFSFTLFRSLIEYNSYVITGGRHPMSISSGMRDERSYRLDDLNRFYRLSVARCSSIRLQ